MNCANFREKVSVKTARLEDPGDATGAARACSGTELRALLTGYWRRRNADCGVAFACANIAVPACTRMLSLEKLVLSCATSTSVMRLLAALKLSFNTARPSLVEFKREIIAPMFAR